MRGLTRGCALLMPVCGVLACLGAPSTVSAQVSGVTADEEQARLHFEQGVALFEEESFEAALAEFRSSYEITPRPFVLYNIGVVERELGRYADAVETLRHFLAETAGNEGDDERRESVRQIVDELDAVLGSVVIESDPAGADLFVDGALEGQTPLPAALRLEAGEHEIELRLDGYQTRRLTLEVRSQLEHRQTLALEELPRSPLYRQWWLWTVVGVVVVGTVLGVVLPFSIEPTEADFGRLQITTESTQ